jgi:uncharacterized protein (TIGR03067 family)
MNERNMGRHLVLRVVLCLAAGLVSLTALGPLTALGADDASDLEKLAGTWNFVPPAAGPAGKKFAVVFQGDTIAFVSASGKRTEGKFKLDLTQDPKTMDIDMNGKSLTLAIYRLEGDTLNLCHYLGPKAAKERPPAFAADKQTVLGIFQRQP